MPTLTVDVPVDISQRDLRIALAVQLYRDGKLTLKQAAELADFCVEDFMKILNEKRVSVISWDERELEKEIKNADSS